MRSNFYFKDQSLPLDRTHVMGVLNVTPDSFSDGGQFQVKDHALKQAEKMILQGCAILDVGGESTRPGAATVSVDEEIHRVMPVVEALVAEFDVIVSVDTSSPELMRLSAQGGAHLINDVRALQRPGAMEVAAEVGLPVCLMHMQGDPKTMQNRPAYADVIDDVSQFFRHRLNACVAAGIDKDRIILDPGFGFGKTLEHNLRLTNGLEHLSVDDLPLLVGMSRKSMIGQVLGKPVDQRLYGSLALAAAAVMKGAWIVRVHDVAETVDVVNMLNSVRHERA